MEYIGVKETAISWGICQRRVQRLCEEKRVYGAKKIGNSWQIPNGTLKPADGRYKNLNDKKELTSIDLFSGPGGLCTGFRWAGIHALIAVEWSDNTVQTYAHSHNAEIFELEDYLNGTMSDPERYFQPSQRTLLIHGDIRKVTGDLIKKILVTRFDRESVYIVTGGAPCESFSMAGDRKEDDDRNILYKNVLRIARAVDSKMFLFENVKGLFSKKYDGKAGAMYRHICKEFQETDPKTGVTFKLAETDPHKVLLRAIEYGVPQNRERLFLVGVNARYPQGVFHYPEKTHGPGRKYPYVTVEDALMDLPALDSKEENNTYTFDIEQAKDTPARYDYLQRMRGQCSMPPASSGFGKSSLSSHKAPGHTERMLNRIKSIQPGESMKTAYERLLKEGKTDFVKANFPKKIYAARNRRLKLGEPSFTVTSHCLDEMIHPTQDRGLTPRECARLQSFPDWYHFEGDYVTFHSDPEQDRYEQIGDAIPPLLGYVLGKEVARTLHSIKGNGKEKTK